MRKTPDSSGRWLWVSVVSFVLMLLALYLGQGLPSLLYVVLVLGLFLLAFVALTVHHVYDLVALGLRVRQIAMKSRLNAAIVLLVGVALVLKLLKVC